MIKLFVILAVFLAGSRAHALEALPLNPEVTQATIDQTICVGGYSRSVRPPVAYTNAIKRQRLLDAGLSPDDAADYELDHRISISAGGAPDDPHNLILQPWPEAKEKDRLENRMHDYICSGRISLREAQERLWNWKP